MTIKEFSSILLNSIGSCNRTLTPRTAANLQQKKRGLQKWMPADLQHCCHYEWTKGSPELCKSPIKFYRKRLLTVVLLKVVLDLVSTGLHRFIHRCIFHMTVNNTADLVKWNIWIEILYWRIQCKCVENKMMPWWSVEARMSSFPHHKKPLSFSHLMTSCPVNLADLFFPGSRPSGRWLYWTLASKCAQSKSTHYVNHILRAEHPPWPPPDLNTVS